MARHDIVDHSIRYTIADAGPVPRGLETWAVVRTRIVDELTLAPPVNPIRLTTNLPRARVRIGNDGTCGLVARPSDVSGAMLTPGALEIGVEAASYLPRDLGPAIDAARRTLGAQAFSGATTLNVLPPDAVPPRQFRPGRGVLLERLAPIQADQITTVASPPLAPTSVPLADPVDATRAVGSHVAGVPLILPQQPLHRAEPLRLRVHLRRRTGPTSLVPAVGAQVGIAGVWLAYPQTQTQSPVAADFCAVAPTLRFAHPLGAAIRRCTLTATGAPRQLRALAPLASRQIVVAPNSGLNPAGGDLLRIGDPLLPEAEIVVSAGFEATANPNAAVNIRLTAPTASIHRPSELARDIGVVATATVGTVDREALSGDAVLLSGGVGALPTSSTIVIEHGTPRAAYYTATRYPTWDGVNFSHQIALDANGRALWPPLARVAQLRLVARHPAHPVQQIDFALEQMADNRVSIVFA